MRPIHFNRAWRSHREAMRADARAVRNDPDRAAKDARVAAIVASAADMAPVQIGSKGQLLTKKAPD